MMPGSVQSYRTPRSAWEKLADKALLQVRLKDLKLTVQDTWLEECMDDLYAELEARDLVIRPHAWLSDEWFSPHDSPGIAIPFYLAHPRLAKLERKMVFDVEGGTRRECMKILRHEAGHVIQRAYALHRRKRWQELFGRATRPYPDYYRPNPTSKNYVQHLRRWYAQSHPDEDFAETFAVWLTPRSRWRARYADWSALKKLEYVDELMGEIAGVRPLLTRRNHVDPLKVLSITLADHYKLKRERYAVDAPSVFDRDLKKIFSADVADRRSAPSATGFVRRNKVQIRNAVARWTGEYPLALDAALDDILDRCRALNLRAVASERKMRLDLTSLLTTKAVHTLYSSPRRQSFAI
jgi:hypothetical protein